VKKGAPGAPLSFGYVSLASFYSATKENAAGPKVPRRFDFLEESDGD
jgi:hypothetical protein